MAAKKSERAEKKQSPRDTVRVRLDAKTIIQCSRSAFNDNWKKQYPNATILEVLKYADTQ